MAGTKIDNLPDPVYEIEIWWMRVWNDFVFMEPNVYLYLKDLSGGFEINEQIKEGFKVMMKYSRDNQPKGGVTPMQQKAKNNQAAEKQIIDFVDSIAKQQKEQQGQREKDRGQDQGDSK